MKENDNKQPTTLWLRPSTLSKIDTALPLAKCRSRSDFAEDAFRYYIDHLISGDVSDYISRDLIRTIRDIVNENQNRQRSLLFRLCVEINMALHMIAAHFRADEVNRRELRAFAVREVKETNGQISFDHALDIQRQTWEDA